MKAKGGLGRGLEALIPQIADGSADDVVRILVADLKPSPYQPRREFDLEKLQELADSIREHGVLQPIVIRKGLGRWYEIIAGERRFRAAKQLGMETIPALVRDITDRQAMEIALIENLQREDLSPIEVAEAYAKIMEHFELTQEQLAVRVGQSRPHVANLLRLLSLPPDIREHVSRGTISMGHARALLALPDAQAQRAVAKKIEVEGLTVRAVEQLVQRLQNVSRGTFPKKPPPNVSPGLTVYEDQLRDILGTSVRVQSGKQRGKIEIEYFSLEDLERIMQILRPPH